MRAYDSFNFGRSNAPQSAEPEPIPAPTRCPACQSGAISTAAVRPDENTYWRCDGCGEVWNAGRRRAPVQRGTNPWR